MPLLNIGSIVPGFVVASACLLSPLTDAAEPPQLKPMFQEIPSAAYRFKLVPIPGDPAKGIKPFYMATTELTWDAFDVYVYSLDKPADTSADAKPAPDPAPDEVSRPSKPYLPPDRGFGHENFAAISLAFKNASEFCRWLSEKSGKHYRLPTTAEWEHAARAGATTPYFFGDDASKLPDYAWFEANADAQPHKVGGKKPNAWGLYDMLGNVAEWCVGADGKPVTKGGSYRDTPDKLAIDGEQKQTPAWNSSDPQVPKSPWWLSDGPFVGFRVVCDIDSPGAPDAKDAGAKTTAPSTPPSKDNHK